jgi:hypothetical protein
MAGVTFEPVDSNANQPSTVDAGPDRLIEATSSAGHSR